jgi:AmiR/NasT family two-component response regulator
MQFNVYYHSPETGEYLCQVVMAAARIGQVGDFRDLSVMGDRSEADVVLVEYQDNNPDLDKVIVRITKKPKCPEIFLFVEEISPRIIWKALALGAQELFSRTIPAEDFQAALTRVDLRHARLGGLVPGTDAWLGLPGWGTGREACGDL